MGERGTFPGRLQLGRELDAMSLKNAPVPVTFERGRGYKLKKHAKMTLYENVKHAERMHERAARILERMAYRMEAYKSTGPGKKSPRQRTWDREVWLPMLADEYRHLTNILQAHSQSVVS